MDQIDKQIILKLLKNGRIQQKSIAEDLGLSAQVISYRFSKLINDGIIKGFKLRVRAPYRGMEEGFAAFQGDMEYNDGVDSMLRCLEKITLYGFTGKDREELEMKIRKAEMVLGKSVMRYIPKQEKVFELTNTDRGIISLLQQDPRMPLSALAKKMDMPYSTIKRRLSKLENNHVIGVITEIDQAKADVVIYSVFSKHPDGIMSAFGDDLVFSIKDNNGGVFVCCSETLGEAKKKINIARQIENTAEVMIIYDYEFF